MCSGSIKPVSHWALVERTMYDFEELLHWFNKDVMRKTSMHKNTEKHNAYTERNE